MANLSRSTVYSYRCPSNSNCTPETVLESRKKRGYVSKQLKNVEVPLHLWALQQMDFYIKKLSIFLIDWLRVLAETLCSNMWLYIRARLSFAMHALSREPEGFQGEVEEWPG